MRVVEESPTVAFAERVLMLLDQGSFTATYKYAVLLGLLDLCLEHTTGRGEAPDVLTTAQLAGKVLALYWPHTAEFDAKSNLVLQQSGSGQAEIVSRIRKYRLGLRAEALPTPTQVRRADPTGYRRLERFVEWKLVEMPLPRLQTIGSHADPFLYVINWSDTIKKQDFESAQFDNCIRLRPGVGEHLRRLNGLLRPLIQREWLTRVAQLNRTRVEHARLEEFLFGVERETLAAVRPGLRELQGNRCFYCDERLPSEVDVDHFIPWARHPDNGIENLVVADRRCNGSKRAFLAAAEHVARWARRPEGDLQTIAQQASWESDPERMLAVARGIYLRLPADAKLWQGHETFVAVDQRRLSETLATG